MQQFFRIILLLFGLCIGVSSQAQQTTASQFVGQVASIPTAVQQKIKQRSWSPICPVPINQLAYLTLSYYGFDHKNHIGHLIINKKLAAEVVQIFHQLFNERVQIQAMKIYADYKPGDYGKNNDTVGFYCSPFERDPKNFSRHAYGVAIDINPLMNPYNSDDKGTAWPKQGQTYLNRSSKKSGMIYTSSQVFKTFTAHGWTWGGLWQHHQDYMHFQKLIGKKYIVNAMVYRPKPDPYLPTTD